MNDSGRHYFHCVEKLSGLSNGPSSDVAQTVERIFNVRVHDVVVDGSIKKQSTMSWPLTTISTEA
jgi:hypothetical protein